MIPSNSRRHRTRRSASALVALVVLCGGLAACDLSSGRSVEAARTDIDTFIVSNNPTATRGTDVVMRIMASAGKTKVGLVSFPVDLPDTAAATGTLRITPRHTGFALKVHNVGPFTNATTYATQPALGSPVGALARTTAGSRQAISLAGVQVSGGRARLAITTTSLYELEIISADGARASGDSATAPTLDLRTEPVAPPVTTAPAPTTPPTTAPSSGWRLTFADEFNGTAVDTSKWMVYDESKGHSVESPKASTCPLANNVSVGGGVLTMRTQKAGGACAGGQAQSGAGLNTWGKFSQAGGRFEGRGRWTERGNYLWGGMWTHGGFRPAGDKTNPSEIDLWEYIGKVAEPNISRFKPAIHYNYTCEGTCGMQNMPYNGYDVTAWHEYAYEWEPTNPADPTTMQIRFYLDDVLITVFDKHGTWRVTSTGTRVLEIAGGWQNPNGAFPNPFGLDRPHQLILSAWVGAPGVDATTVAQGYAPAGGHADLQFDYVRVYQR